MFSAAKTLSAVDPALWQAIEAERERQDQHIELIASENYTSPAVMQAQGSQLTNKYAEGYPGKRFYGGCEFVDQVEQIAIARVKALFGAEYANVQPHSGSQANQAVYFSILKPGDTVMGMNLGHGGHLTHGSPAITTRGFKEEEARLVANLIADVLDNPMSEVVIAATKDKVHALTSRFPVYGA